LRFANGGIAFGGFKRLGVGREGGREGLLPYVERKTALLSEALRDRAINIFVGRTSSLGSSHRAVIGGQGHLFDMHSLALTSSMALFRLLLEAALETRLRLGGKPGTLRVFTACALCA